MLGGYLPSEKPSRTSNIAARSDPGKHAWKRIRNTSTTTWRSRASPGLWSCYLVSIWKPPGQRQRKPWNSREHRCAINTPAAVRGLPSHKGRNQPANRPPSTAELFLWCFQNQTPSFYALKYLPLPEWTDLGQIKGKSEKIKVKIPLTFQIWPVNTRNSKVKIECFTLTLQILF